jgi:hypothetical protein
MPPRAFGVLEPVQNLRREKALRLQAAQKTPGSFTEPALRSLLLALFAAKSRMLHLRNILNSLS